MPGVKKDGGDHLIHKTHNILPGLAVRSSRNLPRKAARVRMTSQGERFGTEGSIPSLGTTAVMRTTAQRQNSSSEGRSRTSHKAGNRINGGSNPPPATKRSDALYEVIIGLGFSCFSLTAGKDRHLGEAQLVRPLLMTAKTLSEAGGSSPPSSHKYRSDAIFHNFFDYWYTQGGQIPPTTGRYTAARSGNDAVVHIWYICRGFDSPRPDQLKN